MTVFPYLKLVVVFTIFACNNNTSTPSHNPTSNPTSKGKNYLTMKIDGKDWIADREVFGSYHFNEELGPGLINIAGVKGLPPNDQPFNINLYHTDSEGEYKVSIADGSRSTANENVSQLAQFSPTNYLCGGVHQNNQMTVKITKVSKNPQMVEATFTGTMQCVEGNTLSITEGKFYYHEENN